MNLGTRTDTLLRETVNFKSGQTSADLPFELLLKIGDSKKLDSPDGRDDILNSVEAQLRRVGSAFGDTMRRRGEHMGGLLRELREKPELFPWVPYMNRQIVVHDNLSRGFLPKLFDISRPLVGQSASHLAVVICEVHTEPWEGITSTKSVYECETIAEVERLAAELAAPRDTSDDLQLLIVRITSIVFQEGTVFSWIQGKMQELTLGATLLTAIATVAADPTGTAIKNVIQTYELHERVTQAVQNEPMVKYRNFKISYDDLQREAGNAFNYEQSGLSDDERRWRTAYVQVALKVFLRIDLKVDGVAGPETIKALGEFARLHNHPATVTNPFTRADLLNVLNPQ